MTITTHTARLAGKVALVTGSTSGIGEAIAERFAAEGAHVIVNGRDAGKGALVVQKIIDFGGSAEFIRADVTSIAEIDQLVDSAKSHNGRIDILVNNAGRMIAAPLNELTIEDWDELVRLDARSGFYLMKSIFPVMEANGGGVALNVTSLAAIQPMDVHALYGFVKAGMTQMVRSIAQEYASRGIRVNSLLPGLVATPMVTDDPNFALIEKSIPMGRASTAAEQANAALFLCSDEASYVTGASLVVSGGI